MHQSDQRIVILINGFGSEYFPPMQSLWCFYYCLLFYYQELFGCNCIKVVKRELRLNECAQAVFYQQVENYKKQSFVDRSLGQ